MLMTTRSIRFPAALTGLYGLRPTTHRVPWRGTRESITGIEGTAFSAGPMASSLNALRRFMAAVSMQEPWKRDPRTLALPWNESKAKYDGERKLVFGFVNHDGLHRLTPPVARAVKMAREAVSAQGHKGAVP